jgi:hypothetical protein
MTRVLTWRFLKAGDPKIVEQAERSLDRAYGSACIISALSLDKER